MLSKTTQNYLTSIPTGQPPATTNPLILAHRQKFTFKPRDMDAHWVWDGQAVSVLEFAELAYGDTAQRTAFILKYSETEK